MKIAALVARILLGIIFLVFGANGFLNFIPQPPMPALHAFMSPAGMPLALLVAILWTLVALRHRSSFDGILAPA